MDSRSSVLYLKYAEMEMKRRNINFARNIWDRAVTFLPRIDQLWYLYCFTSGEKKKKTDNQIQFFFFFG